MNGGTEERAELRIDVRVSPSTPASERLRLTFEERARSRSVVQLEGGSCAVLALPRGAPLRGGDRLVASDGRVVEVVAAPEPLLHADVADPLLLARAAYHLGNRHVAAELRGNALRVACDPVIERMLRGLGLEPSPVDAPFEPEGGAYGHAHAARVEQPAPVIHEYVAR